MMKSDQLQAYLLGQSITADFVSPKPSFFDPKGELHGDPYKTLPFSKQLDAVIDLASVSAESMSLASMYAVTQLDAHDGMNVLDTCAAPAMKGMYLNALAEITYYANDLSGDRIARMKRLLDKHGIQPAAITKYDAKFIDKAYEAEFFDRIIIDAPCSGEGVAMGGDAKLLEAWSPAKVKRLQQLQIKIVKSAWSLLKPNGRLVYATCTLNRNENERVIKKAFGVQLDVHESPLAGVDGTLLKHGHAVRIMPSTDSIGFFVAVLEKTEQEP